MRSRAAVAALLLALTTLALNASVADPKYWAQWRGPNMTGVSRTAKAPIEWSETKNIKWKMEIPGRGSSSPVVWNDRIFLLTAIPVGVTGAAQHEQRPALGFSTRQREAPLSSGPDGEAPEVFSSPVAPTVACTYPVVMA